MEIKELSLKLQNAGVVGCGGAGFPSYAKLNEKAQTIILNCAECEPLFRVHRQLLSTYTTEILTALQCVKEATGARQVVIAIKPDYHEAIEALEYHIDRFHDFHIRYLTNAYPAGDEIITIHEVTAKLVRPGNLPISKGAIVYNVETMLNAYYAITEGAPVTRKYLTVGGAVNNPITVCVPLGITFKELLALAGGASIEDYVYLNGGIMTGRVGSANDIVTKTTNAILILPRDHSAVLKKTRPIQIDIQRSMSVCCQCQSCTELCSRNLMGYPVKPHLVMRAATKGLTSDTQAFLDAFTCSSCGLCELYSCPQGLSPRNIIAALKTEFRKNGVTPPKNPRFTGVDHTRRYKRIPETRLISRLGVAQYDVDAPLTLDKGVKTKFVKLNLSQGIGAKSVPSVKVNDKVKANDVIANVPNGLGVALHSSVNGTVSAITDDYILINTK